MRRTGLLGLVGARTHQPHDRLLKQPDATTQIQPQIE